MIRQAQQTEKKLGARSQPPEAKKQKI